MSAPAVASAMRGHQGLGETAWIWRMLLQGRDHLALILAVHDAPPIGAWEAAEPQAPGRSVGTPCWLR